MTAPPQPDVKPAEFVNRLDVSDSHHVATRVEVIGGGGDGWGTQPRILEVLHEVTGGSVSLDAAAEVRGRCTLTLPATPELIPTSPDDLLAPFGNEVRVSRGIEYYDHVKLVRLGVFRIDRCTVAGNTITLEGLDRSATYIDASFEAPGQAGGGTLITDLIIFVLAGGATSVGFRTDFISHPGVLPWTVTVDEAEDRWAFAQGLATAIGCELYFDRDGTLVLRQIPRDGGGVPSARYSEGPGGVLLETGRNFDRTTVTNKVIVSGENSNSNIIPRGEAFDNNPNSPTYYYGRFGKKPLFTSNDFCGTDEMCRNMAAGILARSRGAPDSIQFSSIVDPARSPSETVIVERGRLGLRERHVLDSVDIPLTAEGAMSCSTRAVELFEQ